MNKLSDWIDEKNKFDGVSMVRLIHNGQAHDYTKWKFSGQNIFFFGNDMKIGHILWTTENIKVIDETHIIINEDNDNYACALTIYYGGGYIMMSFKEYLNAVDRAYHDNAFTWRYGQTIMNVLYQVWPAKYSELTSTENDCFYDDGMVKKTLEILEEEWSDGY